MTAPDPTPRPPMPPVAAPVARELLPPGAWPAGAQADEIVLGFDDRFRRRIVLEAAGGLRFLLDLPQARVIADGAALRLEDGRLIAVRAADEPLMAVRAASPELLLRLAWHIGNRHLAARLAADHILLRRDHVIAAMIAGLGGSVDEVAAPFDPEGGAYAAPGERDERHRHDHDHRHDHHHHG